MRRILIKINGALERLFTWGTDFSSDKRVIRIDKEKLCCKHVKQFGYFAAPEFGIVRLNINYCFVCGKKLRRAYGLAQRDRD